VNITPWVMFAFLNRYIQDRQCARPNRFNSIRTGELCSPSAVSLVTLWLAFSAKVA